MGDFSGNCDLLFFAFWGKEKRNQISSSSIYLVFIGKIDLQSLNNRF